MIDLPQAVDPRKNRHARSFLQRDLERACEWAEAHDGRARRRPRLAADYWTAWEFADLVPEELRGLTM